MLKGRHFFSSIVLVLLFLLPGCSDDRKDDYKGVSELIADRSQARRAIKNQPVRSETVDEDKSFVTEQGIQKKSDPAVQEISPVVLYEEKVKIYSESSDKMLAKGVAYINKQGQIVRLKIVNE